MLIVIMYIHLVKKTKNNKNLPISGDFNVPDDIQLYRQLIFLPSLLQDSGLPQSLLTHWNMYFLNSSVTGECEAKSIFKQSKAGLNSEFSRYKKNKEKKQYIK